MLQRIKSTDMENLLSKELNLLDKIVKKHYYGNHRKYLILA
jgi:hypothetical protein